MWIRTAERQPENSQIVLIWHQGAYGLAYLNHEIWHAIDRFFQGGTIGAVSCVEWWTELPEKPDGKRVASE